MLRGQYHIHFIAPSISSNSAHLTATPSFLQPLATASFLSAHMVLTALVFPELQSHSIFFA